MISPKAIAGRRSATILAAITIGYFVFSLRWALLPFPRELGIKLSRHRPPLQPFPKPPTLSGLIPPVALAPPATVLDPTDPSCDPFVSAFVALNRSKPIRTTFSSLHPDCKPANPSWFAQLKLSADAPIVALQNRTVLFVGDSVDRFLVDDVCRLLQGNLVLHPVTTYASSVSGAPTGAGGLPRTCQISGPSGRQNLTLASYFFYGYDVADLWRDKKATWAPPANFPPRWAAFARAYGTLFRPGSLAGSRPDLVVANVGLWELARFDRLHERAHNGVAAPTTLPAEFVDAFVEDTVDFLARVRKLVGPQAAVRWRQMHTLWSAEGSYFTQAGKKHGRPRFSPVKVAALNAAAKEAVRRAGGVGWWPVGEMILPWPAEWWLRDAIHQSGTVGAVVWGGGVLEYLARTPR